MGIVNVRVKDNAGIIVHLQLQNCLYFPMSPVKIISVTMLAQQFNDQDGTWIKICWYHSTFSWDHEKHTIDFSRPSSKLPILQVNPGYSELLSFCSLFEAEIDRHQPHPLMTCQTLFPTDKLTDISFASNNIHHDALEASSTFILCSSTNNIYSVGDKLGLSRNGVNRVVYIIAVTVDKKHQIPYFSVVLKDGHCIKVTKEFLFPLDEDDFASIP